MVKTLNSIISDAAFKSNIRVLAIFHVSDKKTTITESFGLFMNSQETSSPAMGTLNGAGNDAGASISSAPVIIPKKVAVPPPTDKAAYRFLSGRLTTATTVFVGNISESCNDNLIRHLLQVVGRVINWRRVQGANAKLESFGFVEYADQEDALRALRLVNGLQVGDKQLITKVDDKTRINLDRYEQEQREYVKSLLKAGDLNESQTISQSRQVEDAKIVEELKQLLKGHIVFNKFSYQGQDSQNTPDMTKPSSNYKSHSDTSQNKEMNDSKANKTTPIEYGSRRRNRSSSHDEDVYEKRVLERKKQYKEDCYLNRLKRWQNYEKNLSMEIEKRKSREQRKKIDQQEKKKRLLEFLNSYDDVKDDSKFYRGSAWQTKLLERESELNGDERDRKREQQEEKGEIKTTKISSSELESDSSHHETQESISDSQPSKRPEPEQENSYQNGAEVRENDDYVEKIFADYKADSSRPIGFGIRPKAKTPPKTSTNTGLEEIFVPDEEIIEQPVPKKIKLTVIDEKTKMSAPIEFGPESAKYLTSKERAKKIKKLIENIPTEKDKIFAYDVKWFLVDNQLVEKRVKPWLKKKIIEYIGEEEATLIEYICKKIIEKSSPDVLMKNISMILDEEAEVFIIKLWRLLIYETEAKSMGLIQDN